jgi:hypothetical protein
MMCDLGVCLRSDEVEPAYRIDACGQQIDSLLEPDECCSKDPSRTNVESMRVM